MRVETEILAAEAELRRAVLERDVDALGRLLADDVRFVGPDGSIVDKAKDLETHRSGAMRVVRYEPLEEPEVHSIAPEVYRLLTRIDVAVEIAGVRHEGRYLYTRIYVRRNGHPQIVLAQAVPAVAN